MRAVVALLLGAWCAVVIACGAAHKSAGMAPAVSDAGAGRPHDQRIVDLDHAIDTELEKMSLARPPTPQPPPGGCAPHCDVAPMSPNSVTASGDPTCHPGPSDTCKQSCELSDAICTAATKICAIADELANDAWANDRCASGRATCTAAHEKCCGCQL